MTHDEESAGLLPQNPQNAGLPPQRSGVFVSARVAIVLGVCWVASLGFVSRTGSNPLEAQLNEVKSAASPTTLSMMKRTHLSTDSIKEGVWLTTHLGIGKATDEYWMNSSGTSGLYQYAGESDQHWLDEALKGHGHNAQDICAARSIFAWTSLPEVGSNSYNWHEFQGSQTPSGPLSPEYWWDLFTKYNTEVDDYEDKWNVFLHMGQHMYVKDLAPHLKAFTRAGTKFLARHYKATSPEDEGKTMYVVFVANPYNGNAIILHSKAVHEAALDTYGFIELESSACLYAVALPYSQDRLDDWYDNIYATLESPDGLPRPMPVMDTHPTADMEEVRSYFEDKLKIHSLGADTKLHDKTSSAGECQVFELHLATQFDTAYQARFVYTPSARNFDEVGRYHKYVDEQVRATTGFNEGYSRWMDEHWAFELKDSHTLDQLRFTLESSVTPYHAHVTELITADDGATMTAGSLWAWGVSGMAIEWHGAIDYTTLHDPIGGFDFCTATTECQKADTTCKDVASWIDTDDDEAGASSVLDAGEEGEDPGGDY